MNELLLHMQTKAQLEKYTDRPAHAIGIIGPQGAGKGTLAMELAKRLLRQESLDQYAYYKHIAPEKDSISIEQAREVTAFTALKTTGNGDIRRVIVIEGADTMTREAQNAILKVIEEPPVDTVIILTISAKQAVLPTIVSRLQTLPVAAPLFEDAHNYFQSKDFATSDIQRAYTISDGNIGLMHALLEQSTDHPMVAYIEKAKDILKADTFERLCMIDELVKSKQVPGVLYGLQQTAQSALTVSAKNANQTAMQRWQHILQNVQDARELLHKNAQAKLVLTDLLVSL